MSFLDELKSKLPLKQNQYDDYQQDDYYDEQDYEDSYVSEPYSAPANSFVNRSGADRYSTFGEESQIGVLGQTPRGEADSVAVYTKSGQPVGDISHHATTYNPPSRSMDVHAGAYDTPSSLAAHNNIADLDSYRRSTPQHAVSSTSSVGTSRRYDSQSIAEHSESILTNKPQLPAYILRPESYDDVEIVVKRVRTNQPVVLVFQGVRTEVAKRILDFSFGYACGSGAQVKELGERVFVVVPEGREVKDSDLAELRKQGFIK